MRVYRFDIVLQVNLYVEGNYSLEDFAEYIRKEAVVLRQESFGTELLHAVGYTYYSRAKQFLGKDELLGLTGFWHGVKERSHAVGSFFSVLKSATKAVSSARDIEAHANASAANGQGQPPPPEMLKAAEANMRDLMIKAVTMEVQSVIGDVCDRLLTGTTVGKPKELAKKRAAALKVIGSIYKSIDPPPPGESKNFF